MNNKKKTLTFVETENSKDMIEKIKSEAKKEGRSVNNFLEQLFKKIFG